MTRKEIISRDFELREERKLDCRGTLRVYANKGMGDLPSDLIELFENRGNWYGSNGWRMANPDYRIWDAFVVTHRTNKYYDVYVCGILTYPHTKIEQEEYERVYLNARTVTKRLCSFYDNRTKGEQQ